MSWPALSIMRPTPQQRLKELGRGPRIGPVTKTESLDQRCPWEREDAKSSTGITSQPPQLLPLLKIVMPPPRWSMLQHSNKWLSNFSTQESCLEDLLNYRLLGRTSTVSDSACLGCGPRMSLSNQLSRRLLLAMLLVSTLDSTTGQEGTLQFIIKTGRSPPSSLNIG